MKVAVLTSGVLLVVLTTLASGFGCSTPAPSPSVTPSQSPTVAPSPKVDPLAQLIEGAKKEGTVSCSLVASYTPAPLVQLLRSNIKDKYGVDLDIKITASKGMSSLLADVIMQNKSGVTPTYDLIDLGSDYLPPGVKEGVFEKVDWPSLYPKGTDPLPLPESPLLSSGPILEADATGLMYNPSKIPADQVPKTLNDLANPKWKGRVGIMDYSAYWARWAFVLGKDKTITTLRAILKNQPVLGQMSPLNNKYLLGEIDLAFMASSYLINNKGKGMPTAFRALDFLEIRDYQLVVVKNAPHPNAAKLLAVYLSGPDGVKFSVEKVEKGNSYYPGNHLYDTVVQTKKEGIPIYTLANNAKLLDFTLSPEYSQLQKEIELIIKQGG